MLVKIRKYSTKKLIKSSEKILRALLIVTKICPEPTVFNSISSAVMILSTGKWM